MRQTIRVLHFSSRYEECGVAKYLGHHIQGMERAPQIKNEYFETSPYETHHMSPADLEIMGRRLQEVLRGYDVLHVQHEFGLYAHDAFRRVVVAGKQAGKKVVVSVHIAPNMHGASKPVRLKGLGPRSLARYIREKRHHRNFLQVTVAPLRLADLLLVHNDVTAASLRGFGVREERIRKIMHPIQVFDAPPTSDRISKALNRQNGDIIYATIGFFHRYKGIVEAVKALKFLPANYKLAVLGGMKADSNDIGFYDKVCDLIDTLGVHDRVYITGYVETDQELNALIRDCDVCVYPYDRVYYGHVSSGSINLSFANATPAIAYPTDSIKELAALSDGALVLCETFAYYELARELSRLDIKKQASRAKAFAEKYAWPKVSQQLVKVYEELVRS